MKILQILFFFLITALLSCEKKDKLQNCDSKDAKSLETVYFEEQNPLTYCSFQNISTTEKQVNLVITNQADFEKHFSCSTQPPIIDFEKYFVLAGIYRHHQCATFDRQKVYLCNNKIVYNITLSQQDCQALTSVPYIAVVEREYINLPVEYSIQLK